MSISRDEVRHIAMLSRLEISEDELDQFTHDLAEILDYSEKIRQLDTQDVPPTSHAMDVCNVFREDVAAPSLSTEDAISNCSERDYPFFRVPRVIE